MRNKWAKRIEELRADREETQQQVADAVTAILRGKKIQRETINHWESDTRQLKAEAIKALAQHFNCSADYILGLSDAETSDKDVQFISDNTGLSANSINILCTQKEDFPLSNAFLDSFLSSGSWEKICIELAAALDSYIVASKEECSIDTRHAIALKHLKLNLDDDGYQYDGLPEHPPGTALLPARNAVDFYVDSATRLFGEFVRNTFLESYGRGDKDAE